MQFRDRSLIDWLAIRVKIGFLLHQIYSQRLQEFVEVTSCVDLIGRKLSYEPAVRER